jgi:purine nucleosidase
LQGTCKIIIDTDLGTNIDDAVAVLYALRLPDVEIVGITTNYALSTIRAEVTKRIISLHKRFRPGYLQVPVIAGSSRPLGTHHPYIITSFEGSPILADEFRKANWLEKMNSIEQYEAADFIAESVTSLPHQITVCSIGIPTNIALALIRHPEIADKIKEIVVMGASYYLDEVRLPFSSPIRLRYNSNFCKDALASKIMFAEAKCQIRVIPDQITRMFFLEGEAINYLKRASLGDNNNNSDDNDADETPSSVVGKLMLAWFDYQKHDKGFFPHDPLTINESVYCGERGCLKYVRGTFVVHEWAGFSTFIPSKKGLHWLASSIVDVRKRDAFLKKLGDVLMERD